jgi:anoctamin-10
MATVENKGLQEPFVATQEFKHLFPPTGVETPKPIQEGFEPQLKPSTSELSTTSSSSSSSAIISNNAGIDYVIVFKFPTTVEKTSKNNKTSTTRPELQSYVADSLASITSRLTKVNLRFQVRPGKEQGTLLILVSSPVGPIKKEYRQER